MYLAMKFLSELVTSKFSYLQVLLQTQSYDAYQHRKIRLLGVELRSAKTWTVHQPRTKNITRSNSGMHLNSQSGAAGICLWVLSVQISFSLCLLPVPSIILQRVALPQQQS